MPAQTQIQTRRGTAASWTSTNPTLAAGEIGFESDTGKFKIGNGSIAWTSLAYSAGATAVTYLFNATAAQTTFSGADANGLTLAYTVGAEQVYLNGALLVRGSDYTASNGTSIVLASGALVNDVLNVIAYTAMTVADTYTQAQADAKFFQTANEFSAGKNKIINGDFGIWQRGTSFTVGQGTYYSDRWSCDYADANPTSATVSQQTFTPGVAPVAGYEGTFFLRQTITTVGTATIVNLSQKIEDVRTLAGQTATISFYAKSDSNRTSSLILTQTFGSGGSSPVNFSNTTFNTTTSWQRFTLTVSVPSISGKTIGTNSLLQVNFRQALANGSILDIWGVQLEAGSTASPFQTATGTKQGELAACQRYYFRLTFDANTRRFGVGIANLTTNAQIAIPFPVTLRTTPTALEQSGTAGDYSVFSGVNVTCNAVPTYEQATQVQGVISLPVASGLTAGYAAMGRNINTNAYLGWSAEL